MNKEVSRTTRKKREDKDPVCGKHINRNKAHIVIEHKGEQYLLCCPLCQAEFERDPERYAR
ncbi:MAG: YHS domain-containing protein [Rhodocyclaceae bacterium]|nr:YHS domain-containing protein [Rhodocyclaceae bacterium]